MASVAARNVGSRSLFLRFSPAASVAACYVGSCRLFLRFGPVTLAAARYAVVLAVSSFLAGNAGCGA
ncbi:hypothetical protein MYA_1530 [Burkholderia sp. KJ006]|nr:hypothetical protein MYA_1530 [Burkholderia sp. KJ006]